jgi:hypothetical protein
VVLQPPCTIELNHLLRGGEQRLTIEDVKLLRLAADAARQNLRTVDDGTILRVHAAYGEAGLFQLVLLATAHTEDEFRHFFEVAAGALALRSVVDTGRAAPLPLHNAQLRQSRAAAARLNLNILQPSLSRKLYRAGRHHGSLVYGLGGPRILVSHPFRGKAGDIYDVYTNSVDVVTSLITRGFDGTFHFLDYLPGLNGKVNEVPGWLAWFSIIAAHSDLIAFIHDSKDGFRPAQQQEIEFTPDRVHKTIVDIPHGELRWAKAPDDVSGLPRMYIGKGGQLTEEEWFAMEAEHAMPFIEFYTDQGMPRDRLIVLGEDGSRTNYPLDYPVYGPEPG